MREAAALWRASASEWVWYKLGAALMPRWLYHGPYWWRSVNAWWLGWWGWAFFHTDPWRPGPLSMRDSDHPTEEAA